MHRYSPFFIKKPPWARSQPHTIRDTQIDMRRVRSFNALVHVKQSTLTWHASIVLRCVCLKSSLTSWNEFWKSHLISCHQCKTESAFRVPVFVSGEVEISKAKNNYNYNNQGSGHDLFLEITCSKWFIQNVICLLRFGLFQDPKAGKT